MGSISHNSGSHYGYNHRGAARPPVGSLRAADSDREWVVQLLRQHFADGRLQIDEFSERMDRAYTARTYDQLEDVLEDLPHAPVWGRLQPVRPEQAPSWPAHQQVPSGYGRPSILPWVLIPFGLMLLTMAWPLWPMWFVLFWIAVISIRGRAAHHRRYHW